MTSAMTPILTRPTSISPLYRLRGEIRTEQ
jgi:hypothetical protein